MPRLVLAIVFVIAALIALLIAVRLVQTGSTPVDVQQGSRVGCSEVAGAFSKHSSGAFLTVAAKVDRLLPDSVGTRVHQRFIVACPSGQTVLITNDISIGKRAPIRIGEKLVVRGQYIWNSQGGLIHFAHHDPSGGEGGWIYVGGRVYSLGQTGFPRYSMSFPTIS